MDAWHVERSARIDAFDPRMRVRRHHHRAVQHARQLDVVDVARAAGEEALVLDAADRLADTVSVHRSLAARRAPSAIAWNLAQITLGCTSGLYVACDEKPQSALAMTRSGPTRRAKRARRSAISSGCSTMLLAWVMTPGTRSLSSGSFAHSQ